MPVRLYARDVRSTVAGARRAARRLREVCGLLVDHGGLVRMVPTPNRSKEPCSFWIGRQDWRRVEKAAVTLGSRVVGTYHSHVVSHPVPGAGDLRMNLGQWLGFMVTVLPYGLFFAPDEPWFPRGAGPSLGVVLLHVAGEIGVFAAIRRGPSALVNAIAGLYPVPSILFVGVVLGEWPHRLAWLGIALALAGIALAVPDEEME